MKTIRVCAAILENDAGDIWCAQRGYGAFRGLYEFPGGKLEPGETPEQALVREIREELGCGIRVERFFMKAEYDYPDFHLDMDCYLCRFAGEPIFWSTWMDGSCPWTGSWNCPGSLRMCKSSRSFSGSGRHPQTDLRKSRKKNRVLPVSLFQEEAVRDAVLSAFR